MTVDLGLDELLDSLRARDYYSLPVDVHPSRRGADLVELRAAVQRALGVAFESALTRYPNDPTTTTEADVALKSVTFEINDGPMTDSEIVAWLQDFAAALEGQAAVRVRALKQRTRIPWAEIESWGQETDELIPTAFVFFDAPEVEGPNGRSFKHLQPDVVAAVAEDLDAWVRVPNGIVTVSRGLTDFICPPGEGARQLQAVFSDFLTLRQFTLSPRRNAFAAFKEFGAEGTLQYYDEKGDAVQALAKLAEALRFLAPYLSYAYVRLDRPVLPSPYVWKGVAGRDPTARERNFESGKADEYAIGPRVMQILGPRHLSKGPDLAGFTSEPLVGGRALVIAEDVQPWLTEFDPPADLAEWAETQFEPILVPLDGT